MKNLWKEGSPKWWRVEISRTIEKELGDKATDENGNMSPLFHSTLNKAIFLWEHSTM